jgi:hypothetical protein
MAYPIGVDDSDPGGGEKTADLGLSRADPTGQQPTTVL